MIVWGGTNGFYLNSGGQYDPVGNTWAATTGIAAPSGRYYHSAVWTGAKMIVWGGFAAPSTNTGGLYSILSLYVKN
jgi:hypothetical protein